MKKTFSILCAIPCVIAILVSSCQKDKTPPVIKLEGDVHQIIPINIGDNPGYTDPGYSAVDDEGGPAAVFVSGNVDIAFAKVYNLTYTSTDADENTSTTKRTVTVIHTDATTSGTVLASNGGISYNEILSFVEQDGAERVYTQRFANYDSTTVYFNLSGTTGAIITVPSQTVTNSGNPAMERTFSGAGSISEDGKTIIINYNETINGVPSSGGSITYLKSL